MKITLKILKAKDACESGLNFFQTHFPEGGDYREVIDKCMHTGNQDYAYWIVRKFSTTTDVLTLDDFKGEYLYFPGSVVADSINVKDSIRVGGKLIVKSNITANNIIAGGDIEAGDIKVREWIATDDCLTADSIEAGNIMAGSIKAKNSIESKKHSIRAYFGDIECSDGNVISKEDIEASKGHIKVGWVVDIGNGHKVGHGGIEAGLDIRADKTIEAGRDITSKYGTIRANDGIKVGWGIEAGQSIITDNGPIEAGQRIVALNNEIKALNGEIKAGQSIKALNGEISANEIKAGWGIIAGQAIEALNGEIRAGGDIDAFYKNNK